MFAGKSIGGLVMRWILITFCLSFGCLAYGCSKTDPELDMKLGRLQADLEAAQAESVAAQKTIEELKSTMRDLLEENSTLTDRLEMLTIKSGDQRIAQLERELAAAQQDAARYRAGLEGAVDTLNQQAQKHNLEQYVSELEKREAQRAASRPRPASTPPSSGKDECCVHVRQPYLSHVETSVVVSGDIKNSRSTDIGGDAVVDLFDGNDLIDSQSVRMNIPSGLEDSYEVTFSGVSLNGDYRTRVRWEDFIY